jgi:hypothetical protein
MKKSVVATLIILTLLTLLLLVGCVDYKAYDLQEESFEDTDLVDEVAQIERELAQDSQLLEGENVVEEEIILPDLEEEPEPISEELQVITVKENERIILKPTINDPDEDPVTVSFSKPLDELGEWRTQYGDAGEYTVTITADDGVLTTTKKVKLVVERVNVAPVLKGIRDITIHEGETASFEPLVADPNNDEVEVSISEPLKDGSFETDHTSAGEYAITVVASDGELETKQAFKLIVLNVNEKPEITNVDDLVVEEGELILLKPIVTDLDGDELKVTISEPVGSDGEWQTSFTDHGEYTVTIFADDGKDQVSKRVQITIKDVNKAPEIIDVTLLRN